MIQDYGKGHKGFARTRYGFFPTDKHTCLLEK